MENITARATLMGKMVNFIYDETLLEKFDTCVEKLALTRTDLLLGLMRFVVQATQDSTLLKDLKTARQNLQKLMELRERAQEIREAEKRLTEIEKQANKERCRIFDAQQVVIEALKNLEALNMEARPFTKKFPELTFVYVDIPQPIKKFSYPDAVPTSWTKL